MRMFQFLIGSLKTTPQHQELNQVYMFQFLIGSLKTLTGWIKALLIAWGFNSS